MKRKFEQDIRNINNSCNLLINKCIDKIVHFFRIEGQVVWLQACLEMIKTSNKYVPCLSTFANMPI